MSKKINYVTIFYIINCIIGAVSFGLFYGNNNIIGAILAIIMILFLGFGGYLNAKNGKTFRSVLWIGFFNLVLGIISIYAIEVLHAKFSIFGGSTDSVLFVLFQYLINSYLYPFLQWAESISESLAIIFVVACSFVFPISGYLIGKKTIKK